MPKLTDLPVDVIGVIAGHTGDRLSSLCVALVMSGRSDLAERAAESLKTTNPVEVQPGIRDLCDAVSSAPWAHPSPSRAICAASVLCFLLRQRTVLPLNVLQTCVKAMIRSCRRRQHDSQAGRMLHSALLAREDSGVPMWSSVLRVLEPGDAPTFVSHVSGWRLALLASWPKPSVEIMIRMQMRMLSVIPGPSPRTMRDAELDRILAQELRTASAMDRVPYAFDFMVRAGFYRQEHVTERSLTALMRCFISRRHLGAICQRITHLVLDGRIDLHAARLQTCTKLLCTIMASREQYHDPNVMAVHDLLMERLPARWQMHAMIAIFMRSEIEPRPIEIPNLTRFVQQIIKSHPSDAIGNDCHSLSLIILSLRGWLPCTMSVTGYYHFGHTHADLPSAVFLKSNPVEVCPNEKVRCVCDSSNVCAATHSAILKCLRNRAFGDTMIHPTLERHLSTEERFLYCGGLEPPYRPMAGLNPERLASLLCEHVESTEGLSLERSVSLRRMENRLRQGMPNAFKAAMLWHVIILSGHSCDCVNSYHTLMDWAVDHILDLDPEMIAYSAGAMGLISLVEHVGWKHLHRVLGDRWYLSLSQECVMNLGERQFRGYMQLLSPDQRWDVLQTILNAILANYRMTWNLWVSDLSQPSMDAMLMVKNYDSEAFLHWIKRNRWVWDMQGEEAMPSRVVMFVWDNFEADLLSAAGSERELEAVAKFNGRKMLNDSAVERVCNTALQFVQRFARVLLEDASFIKLMCYTVAPQWPQHAQHIVTPWVGHNAERAALVTEWLEEAMHRHDLSRTRTMEVATTLMSSEVTQVSEVIALWLRQLASLKHRAHRPTAAGAQVRCA